MKNIFRISGVILNILLIFLIQSCKKDKPQLPTVITTAVTAISYTTATSGGDMTNEGGAPIISQGVCWNTSADPTISNSKTTDSGVLGVFTSNITRLTPNTMYYLRAYATNSAGAGYGNQVSFTTNLITLAILTTKAITPISPTTVVSGGIIADDNDAYVTARGVCWGTETNPTAANSKTSDGEGSGEFFSSITGLTPVTTYYVRAYATNNIGTAYGNELVFTTPISIDSTKVYDAEGNVYNKVTIGTQVWMKENLRVTRFRDGAVINKVTDPEKWFTSLTTPLYGENFYNSTDVLTYGRFYDSYVVLDSRNICPVGWHVPTDSEWTTLVTFLGGDSIAGGKLKSITGWDSPNTGATNESGFSAVAGSYPVKPTGINGVILPASYTGGVYGYWWSSSGLFEKIKCLEYSSTTIYNGGRFASAYSIRCLKD